MNPDDIIDFWFAGCEDDPEALKARGSFWYSANNGTDDEIRQRFGALHDRAAAGDLGDWATVPRGRLALILLLDQMSRNIYRGSERAFAFDGQAQRLCLGGIDQGQDGALHPVHRSFYYMPLEHAEDNALQQRSLACFEALAANAQPAFQEYFDGARHWAREHAQVVDRFGRFPHRNRVLGRDSTDEEIQYLKSGGSSYGQ